MAVNAEKLIIERIKDLERRVQTLEEHDRTALWGNAADAYERETNLILSHGEYVDKTTAARILGVTRATIYAMLADGRLDTACEGRRVDVRSIARYVARRRKKHER